MGIPYARAQAGLKARDEIVKMLQRFGCESVGFMDEFETQTVLLAFRHRGRPVQLRASARGWAALYMREYPVLWRKRHKPSRAASPWRS